MGDGSRMGAGSCAAGSFYTDWAPVIEKPVESRG